jgi:hypothetical protein
MAMSNIYFFTHVHHLNVHVYNMWRVIQGFKTLFIFSYFNLLMVMLIHIEVHDINTHCSNVDINSNLHFVD